MINFLKYRYLCLAFSVILLASGIVAYIVKGGFQYHIDFVGGAQATVSFEKPVSIASLRQVLSDAGWKDLSIQSVGFAENSGTFREFLVRTKDGGEDFHIKLMRDASLVEKGNKVEIRSVERVGAEVGKDISWNAFVAVLLCMLAILLYVSIRSKYRFAIGAVSALAHDLLAVLVIFLILGEQISVSVLAAILAILGYSINDTIVIFSRVRENMKKLSHLSELEIVNVSINQTLRRTLLTSFSTLLSVISILIFGGEALYGLALTMLIGIIFGTYSSIYIASPIMLAIGSESKR